MALALDASVSGNSGSSGSFQVTITTTVAACVLLAFITTNGGPVTGITDSAGLTWTHRATGRSVGGETNELWYAIAASQVTSDIITVATTSANFITVHAFAVSGADTASPFDGTAVTDGTAPADPLSISTTNADTMIIGGFRFSGTGSPTAGTGFTSIAALAAGFQLAEYQIVAATQTNLDVTVGTGVGDSGGGIADAIKAAAAGGGARLIGGKLVNKSLLFGRLAA